jgi:hypothetical protein
MIKSSLHGKCIYIFYVCNALNHCKLFVTCDLLSDERMEWPFRDSFHADLYIEKSGNNK